MIDTLTSRGNSWRKRKSYDARRDGRDGGGGKIHERRKEEERRRNGGRHDPKRG